MAGRERYALRRGVLSVFGARGLGWANDQPGATYDLPALQRIWVLSGLGVQPDGVGCWYPRRGAACGLPAL